jgi:hypothetical protein
MNLGPLINAFPRKIRVTFIHAVTKRQIGIQKMKPEELPSSFNKPIIIKWEGTEWRIMNAEPINGQGIILADKLTLYVEETHSVKPHSVGFNIATICPDWPEFTEKPLFNDFSIQLSKEQWRQLEFLPITLLATIQEEMQEIEPILFPKDGTNTLKGYKSMHSRKNIFAQPHDIFVSEFCNRMNIIQKGNIRLEEKGFIQEGFAFRSDSYTYYGLVKKDSIKELCLHNFESVDEEFFQIAEGYNLILADWCNGKLIMI